MPGVNKKYFEALILELERLGSLALPETWADTNELMRFLRKQLSQQHDVLIANEAWNLSATEAEKQIDKSTQFSFEQFLQEFLLGSNKNKFILPLLLNQSHFAGIVIAKHSPDASTPTCEISYFNPTGVPAADSAEDKEALDQLRKALEKLAGIITKIKQLPNDQLYQDEIIGQLTQEQIDHIKRDSFVFDSNFSNSIKILSDKQQINGCDCGYIVGQTLVELGLGQQLSIKRSIDDDYVVYAKSIAKVRVAFAHPDTIRLQWLSRLGNAVASNETFAKPLREFIAAADTERDKFNFEILDQLKILVKRIDMGTKGLADQQGALLSDKAINFLTSSQILKQIDLNTLKQFCNQLLKPYFKNLGDVIFRLNQQTGELRNLEMTRKGSRLNNSAAASSAATPSEGDDGAKNIYRDNISEALSVLPTSQVGEQADVVQIQLSVKMPLDKSLKKRISEYNEPIFIVEDCKEYRAFDRDTLEELFSIIESNNKIENIVVSTRLYSAIESKYPNFFQTLNNGANTKLCTPKASLFSALIKKLYDLKSIIMILRACSFDLNQPIRELEHKTFLHWLIQAHHNENHKDTLAVIMELTKNGANVLATDYFEYQTSLRFAFSGCKSRLNQKMSVQNLINFFSSPTPTRIPKEKLDLLKILIDRLTLPTHKHLQDKINLYVNYLKKHQKNNNGFLSHCVSCLTGTDIETYVNTVEHKATYVGHLEEHKGTKETSPGKETKLESWLQESFLSSKIRNLFKILAELDSGIVNIARIVEYNKNAQPHILFDIHLNISNAIKKELLSTLETLHIRLILSELKQIGNKDDKNELLSSFVDFLFDHLSKCKVGETFCFPVSWQHQKNSGHSVYVNFIRKKDCWLILIDNLGEACNVKHPKTAQALHKQNGVNSEGFAMYYPCTFKLLFDSKKINLKGYLTQLIQISSTQLYSLNDCIQHVYPFDLLESDINIFDTNDSIIFTEKTQIAGNCSVRNYQPGTKRRLMINLNGVARESIDSIYDRLITEELDILNKRNSEYQVLDGSRYWRDYEQNTDYQAEYELKKLYIAPPINLIRHLCSPFIETQKFHDLNQLIQQQNIIVIAVTQMSGMGKTQLVRHCVKQRYEQYQQINQKEKPILVCELDSNDFFKLSNGFRGLAQTLELDRGRANQSAEITSPDDLERLCRQIYFVIESHYEEAILIFDDATRLKGNENLFGIQAYLPASTNQKIKVIITSRREDFFLDNNESYRLFNLERGYFKTAAVELVREINPKLADDPNLEELLSRLGYLPLAINLIAHYSKQKEDPKTCQQLIEEIKQNTKTSLDTNLSRTVENHDSYDKSIYSALSLPLKKIQQNEVAWELLVFASFIGSQEIDKALFEQYLKLKFPQENDLTQHLRTTFNMFKDFSLLNSHTENAMVNYDIHVLVQDVVRSEYKSSLTSSQNNQLPDILLRMATVINESLKGDDYVVLRDNRKQLVHGNTLLDHIIKEYPQIEDINLVPFFDYCRKLNYLLADRLSLARAKRYAEHVLKINEHCLGENHISVAASYNGLASILRDEMNLDQALEYSKKAITIIIQEKQPEQLDKEQLDSLTTSFHNIACIFKEKGGETNLDQALEYALNAIAIQEKQLGQLDEEHSGVLALCYKNLAEILQALGGKDNLNLAVQYVQQALDILKKQFGEEHHFVAINYHTLAWIHKDLGGELNLKQALKYSKKAITIQEKQLGKKHPELAQSYHVRASIFYDLGGETHLMQALQCQQQVRAIYEKHFGKEHLYVALASQNLVALLKDLGGELNLKQALEYLKQALEIFEKEMGSQHIETKITRAKLIDIEQKLASLHSQNPTFRH